MRLAAQQKRLFRLGERSLFSSLFSLQNVAAEYTEARRNRFRYALAARGSDASRHSDFPPPSSVSFASLRSVYPSVPFWMGRAFPHD